MKTEGVEIVFKAEAVDELAAIAVSVNEKTENIGARRLHTALERLLEDVSFNAPDMQGIKVNIDRNYVQEKLSEIVKDEDLSRYIL